MKAVLINVLLRILTEKVIISITLHLAAYLASKSTNKLDDELVLAVKKALEEKDG